MRRGLLTALLAAGVATPVAAQAVTRDEALALAFPGARVERRTAYLDEGQVERASALAGPGVAVDRSVVTYYVAYREGQLLGAAYLDVHRVRTVDEVAMVVVGVDDRVERVEVLRFLEPPEYRAPDGWIRQMRGRGLGDGLSLKDDIVPMTGATLTSRALVGATRRVLALHAVIRPFDVDGGA